MKFMQIKPQKCRGKFTESMWLDPAWSAEVKYDGDRRITQFCRGIVRFTGTRQSVGGGLFVEKSENLPHLNKDPPCGLEGTVLDGEIVAPWAEKLPGGSSKHVTAIMGSSPERAVALQRERGWLEYRVFDCLWYKGEDKRGCSLPVRRGFAQAAVREWHSAYVRRVDFSQAEANKREMWEHAREGIVFKHQDHTYGDERLWVKLKKEATADVVVMGFKPGKGQHAGKVGAIKFGQWRSYRMGEGVAEELTEYGTVRGFDSQTMEALTRHGKKYMYKVFRIKHNGREPTGAFRHPRFDSWRDNKDSLDCVYDPDES